MLALYNLNWHGNTLFETTSCCLLLYFVNQIRIEGWKAHFLSLKLNTISPLTILMRVWIKQPPLSFRIWWLWKMWLWSFYVELSSSVDQFSTDTSFFCTWRIGPWGEDLISELKLYAKLLQIYIVALWYMHECRYNLSMAVSDFLVTGFSVPITCVTFMYGAWTFGESWCTVYEFITDFTTGLSVFNFTALSVVRSNGVRDPMKHLRGQTPSSFTPARIIACKFFCLANLNVEEKMRKKPIYLTYLKLIS